MTTNCLYPVKGHPCGGLSEGTCADCDEPVCLLHVMGHRVVKREDGSVVPPQAVRA